MMIHSFFFISILKSVPGELTGLTMSRRLSRDVKFSMDLTSFYIRWILLSS